MYLVRTLFLDLHDCSNSGEKEIKSRLSEFVFNNRLNFKFGKNPKKNLINFQYFNMRILKMIGSVLIYKYLKFKYQILKNKKYDVINSCKINVWNLLWVQLVYRLYYLYKCR